MEYEKSNNELYAEKWFVDNGFEVVDSKQYISKTIYIIKKHNIEMKWELPSCVTEIQSYMKFCEQHFNLYCLLRKDD